MKVSLESHRAGYSLFDATRASRSDLEELWVIISLCGAIFADRHFDLANRNPACAFGHRVLGCLESLPVLGGVIALIEAVVYHLFCSSDTPEDRPISKKTYTKYKAPPPGPPTTNKPYGLQNSSGSDCFLISNLQMILNNKAWMEWAKDSQKAPEIWKTIVRLHQEGTLQNNIATIRRMLVKLAPEQLAHLAYGQQDAAEALHYPLDKLPDDYKMSIEIRRPGRAPKTELSTYLSIPLTDSIETYFDQPHPEELQKVDQNGQSIPVFGLNNEPVRDIRNNLTYEIETVQTTLHLQNAPPSFVVQLKRFDNNQRKIQTRYTILPQVHIPITNADRATYNLTSITNHLGATITSGHYMNYRKVEDQWFQLNDGDTPQKISEKDVLTSIATSCYILNYSLQVVRTQKVMAGQSQLPDNVGEHKQPDL